MHEKFREAWKGAAYVASGLHSDFPDVNLELTMYSRDKVIKRVCTPNEVGHVMEELCKQFPMASVYYHGDSAYGFVAQIRCHCRHEKSRGCCRDGGHHRAKLMVTLLPREEEANLEERSGV
jgi:hypothetical protein